MVYPHAVMDRLKALYAAAATQVDEFLLRINEQSPEEQVPRIRKMIKIKYIYTLFEQKKSRLLLTITLAKRDLVEYFLTIFVHSVEDFHWHRLMKYTWNTEVGHVQIEQCFSIIIISIIIIIIFRRSAMCR